MSYYNYPGAGAYSAYSASVPQQQPVGYSSYTAFTAPAPPAQAQPATGYAGYGSAGYPGSTPTAAKPTSGSTYSAGGTWGTAQAASARPSEPGRYPSSGSAGFGSASSGGGNKGLSGSLASSFVAQGSQPKSTKSISGSTSYTGYDAAVYAAATNYLQSKSRGGNIDSWSKQPSSGGGGGRGGGGGVSTRGGGRGGGGFPNKRGGYGQRGYNQFSSPQERLRTMEEHYCEICKVSCLSAQTYQAHIQGKQHKKKEVTHKQGTNIVLPNSKNSYKCEVCSVTCASSDAFNAHVRGKSHVKTVKLLTELGKPVGDHSSATVIPPKNAGGLDAAKENVQKISFVGGNPLKTGANADDDDDKNKDDDPQPVGQDYVESKRDDHGHTVYYCKLCACDIIDACARDMHLKGKRHRLQFKKKVNPELEVDLGKMMRQYARGRGRGKGSDAMRREIMRMKQQEMATMRMKYEAEMETLMQLRQQACSRSVFPVSNDFASYGTQMQPQSFRMDLLEDKYIIQKHKEVYPTEAELTAVQRIVNHAEQALKGVSDAIEAARGNKSATGGGEADKKDEKKDENDDDASGPQERLLKGVMRVGDLAKGLLLKNNLNLQIVLLCSEKPTRSLLSNLFQQLQAQFKKMELSDVYAVQMNVSEGSISMVTKDTPVKEGETETKENIKITLAILVTSVLVRVQAEGVPSAPDPKDMLPKEKCLEALAVLRQAKWFQARCAHIQSGVLILRVLRDLCMRVPTWAPLSPWALELLVEKVVSTVAANLSVGEAFRRVFEAMASGVLLPFGPGLLDPCEKDPIDAAASLSPQQREDITASAQHALRLIAFGKMHEVLSVEKPDSAGGRKRPLVPELNDKKEEKIAKTDEKKK